MPANTMPGQILNAADGASVTYTCTTGYYYDHSTASTTRTSTCRTDTWDPTPTPCTGELAAC